MLSIGERGQWVLVTPNDYFTLRQYQTTLDQDDVAETKTEPMRIYSTYMENNVLITFTSQALQAFMNHCIQEGKRRAITESIDASLIGWKGDIDRRLKKWEMLQV
ncbi:MAG: hypothetical protein ACYDHX_07710 [Methanothrix sp.]